MASRGRFTRSHDAPSAETASRVIVTPPDEHPSNVNPLTGSGLDDKSAKTALIGFRFIERALLIVAAVMTIGATGIEIVGVYRAQTITLADILLIFLYTEVMGMIAVFYTGRGSPFVYPIFIAVTALARLIVLQGKDMAPENILFEAAAILLLAIAAVIIIRAGKG
jgi:protein PsiE